MRVLRAAQASGPTLRARYAMTRVFEPLGPAFETEFDVHVHGLGYSLVEVDVTSHGLRTKNFVFATPTDAGINPSRIGISVAEPRGKGPLAALLPRRRLAGAVARALLVAYARDVGQDFRFWGEGKSSCPAPRSPLETARSGFTGGGRANSIFLREA